MTTYARTARMNENESVDTTSLACRAGWKIGELQYELQRRRHRAFLKVVWKLPRYLAYWCAIRVISEATTGEHSNQVVPDLTAMDALKRWTADG